MRTRQPEVYDSLGRPTLFLSNTVENGWAFTRFLLLGRFQTIDDPEIVRPACPLYARFRYLLFRLFCRSSCFPGFLLALAGVAKRWPNSESLPPSMRAQEVHARRADEAGDEQVGGLAEHGVGIGDLLDLARRCMMTIRSAIVMASIWSCVT